MRVKHSSRTLRTLGAFAVCLGFLGLVGQSATYLVAQEEPALPAPEVDDAGPITLSEVLSGDVPGTFSQSVLEELLPESWSEWGYEVNELFVELYEEEPGSDDIERILSRIAVKRDTLNKTINDSQYRMMRSRLLELRAQIDRNMKLVLAVHSAIESGNLIDPTQVEGEAFNRLTSAVVAAKNDLAGVNTGSQWKSYFHLDDVSRIANARQLSGDDAALLSKVADRLTDLDRYSGDQKTFVQRSSLTQLGAAVSELSGMIASPVTAREATLAQLREIVQAVNEYEYSSTAASAGQLRQALTTSSTTRVAGQLAAAVRQQFLSDNFRASISESLIRRLLSDSNVERGIINDCAFGARVVGDQWTATDLSVDLVPSMTTASFVLSLNGSINTNTRGITPKATVYTKGNHTFTASKTVHFDGYRFSSTSATVGVNANNQTYNAAARTKIPIIKGIIRNIAMQRARELKPRSDALARRKISDQVSSRFDSEVSETFTKAESKLNSNLYARLSNVGLSPERQTVSSTSTTLDISARVMNSDEVAASPPPSIPYVSSGLAGQIHQSYLNNALNRMDIAGRTMSSEELKQEFKRFAEEALGRKVDMQGRSEVINQGPSEG